jgi:hypothetical protein
VFFSARSGLLGDLSGEGVLCGEGKRGDFGEVGDGILFIMIFGVKGFFVMFYVRVLKEMRIFTQRF